MVFVGHSVREMCLCSMGLKCGSDSLPCAVQTLSVIWKRFEKIVVLHGFECHVVVISCFHSTEWHGLFYIRMSCRCSFHMSLVAS